MNKRGFQVVASKALCLSIVSSCVVLIVSSAQAVVFTFEYTDDSGVGFLDPVNGAQRRAALEYAGTIWGSLIRSSYEGETIRVSAKYAAYDDDTTIASALPAFNYANFGSTTAQYMTNIAYPKALGSHLYGTNLDASKIDIDVKVNDDTTNYYFGTDGNVPAGQLDFVTVAIHELGHGLGFNDSFDENGSYGLGDFATVYDRFVTLGPNGTFVASLSQTQRENALVSNNLYWGGTFGLQANGNSPPRLFAPATWDDGSSVSHIDPTGVTDAVMVPAAGGTVIHAPNGFERGMLRDMGWDITTAGVLRDWSGLGADSNWNTPDNWIGNQAPRGFDSVVFGNSAKTDVNVHYGGTPTAFQGSQFLGAIRFDADAPAYTLRFRSWTETNLSTDGVVTNSPNPQTIILESFQDDYTLGRTPLAQGAGGRLNFSNTASAGDANYQLHGGVTEVVCGLSSCHFVRNDGARMYFDDSSTAATGAFVIEGGSGNGGPNARIVFAADATAGDGDFTIQAGRIGPSLPVGTQTSGFGGQVRFEGNSAAGTANFTTLGEAQYHSGTGGIVQFEDNSNAQNAQIWNNGATYLSARGGGLTFFIENSSAGSAVIVNRGSSSSPDYLGSGRTSFFDSARGGSSVIVNEGGAQFNEWGGITQFYENSSLENGNIENRGGSIAALTLFRDFASAGDGVVRNMPGALGGRTEFRNKATASTSELIMVATAGGQRGGEIEFRDDATAAQSDITFQPQSNGIVRFMNRATAGQATIDFGVNSSLLSTTVFQDQSTAADANISVRRLGLLDFRGNSTAGHSTVNIYQGGSSTFNSSNSSAGNALIFVHGSTQPFGGGIPTASLSFYGGTAANATVTARGGTDSVAPGGIVRFEGTAARAGNATLIANGGTNGGQGAFISFSQGAQGNQARLVANAGGRFDFSSNHDYGGTEVGSIEGAGRFLLNAPLTVGNLNTDTAVTGSLEDGFGFPSSWIGSLTKVGTGTLTLAGTNSYTGLTTIADGTVRVNGTLAGSAVVQSGATLGGTGTIAGSVSVEPGGTFSPGSSPGTITVGGLNLSEGAILNFELGATRDRIIVNGGLTVDGSLNISLLEGFTPNLGQSFPIFEGAFGQPMGVFDSVNAPVFSGRTLDVMYDAGQVLLQVVEAVLPDGDFNMDGKVDAADYVVWRKTEGNAQGYSTWRANFGGTAGSGADSSSDASVPEPASCYVILFAIFAAFTPRRASFG